MRPVGQARGIVSLHISLCGWQIVLLLSGAAQQGLHALVSGHTLPEQGSGVVQHTAENLLAQQGTLYQLEGTVASLFGRHYYDTAVWEQRAG
jgi:hypothetical protein